MVPPIPIKARVQPNVHVSILELLRKLNRNRTAGLFDDGEDLLGFDALDQGDVDFFNGSGLRAQRRDFHLHRFHNDHHVVFFNMVASLLLDL